MSNNDTLSGDGKKGEEELLDFDFDTSSEDEVVELGGDFASDEEILELVDIVEPSADISDSESDEISKLLEEEPGEEPEEKVLDLGLEGLDEPKEEDSSQILESDIGTVLDELELSGGEADKGDNLFEESESDEIAKMLEEEPGEEPEEKVLDLGLEGLDEPKEEDSSQILESDIGTVLDDLELSGGEADKGDKLFEDSEADEISKLLEEEPVEEGVGVGEAEDLDIEELEEISEEDETQVFEAGVDTTVANLEPAEEIGAELELDEGDLESIYDDEALGVSKLEPEELPGLEEEPEAPVAEEETTELGADMAPEIPFEDLSGGPLDAKEALESDTLPQAGPEITGISEERIEAIIREVVEEVVERVAKETMVTVAEKVIKSAIDALKESIDSSLE